MKTSTIVHAAVCYALGVGTAIAVHLAIHKADSPFNLEKERIPAAEMSKVVPLSMDVDRIARLPAEAAEIDPSALKVADLPAWAVGPLVRATIQAKNLPKRRALVAQMQEHPFWSSNFSRPTEENLKILHALRAITRDEEREIRATLGSGSEISDPLNEEMLRRKYDYLPPTKVEKVAGLLSDYAEMRNETIAANNGSMDSATRERLRLIEGEARRELRSLLSPEELQEHDLRWSDTASLLRRRMAAAQPTEAEFRLLFQLATSDSAIAGGQDELRLGDGMTKIAKLLPSKATTLSPDRLQELHIAADPSNTGLVRLAQTYRFPLASIPAIQRTATDAREQVARVQRDMSISSSERANRLRAIAERAITELRANMPAEAVDDYLSREARWLPRSPSPKQ